MTKPLTVPDLTDGTRELLLGELNAGAEPRALLIQSVAEMQRGLVVLATELDKWAKINTVHGKRQIGSTLAALQSLVAVQDSLVPIVSEGPVGAAMRDVMAERGRQDAKWGQQNHPDGTGPEEQPFILHGPSNPGLFPGPFRVSVARLLAESFKTNTDVRAESGEVTWRDILLEEVFEAIAEGEPQRLRDELIQTAAVAVQWAEAIDRRAEVSL